MKSPVVKRSIVIAGHKTSVSLEEAFWRGLKGIATARHTSLSTLVGAIDAKRPRGNLSSAIRLFVLDHFQARLAGPGAGELGDQAQSNLGPVEGARVGDRRSTLIGAPLAGESLMRPE
jgi:predicted DNA-binding ribbon-helix-helix protein